MTINAFARKYARRARSDGVTSAVSSATKEAARETIVQWHLRRKQRQLERAVTPQRTLLDELRERDRWCLLVFDAGRYDYCAPILRDHYTGSVQRTFSAARDTFEWITDVWNGEFGDVTYLSGMVPVAEDIPDFDAEEFKRLYGGASPGESIGEIIELWRSWWDEGVATVPPEAVTDVALDYSTQDKLVVHYNQPHSPYIGTPQLLGHQHNSNSMPARGRPTDEPIWERVRRGEVSDEYLRMAYWGNAARAIAAAKPLVREREIVVATSDHGEALGEWGAYTHKRDPHPKRRLVPWQVITGIQERAGSSMNTETMDEKLRALGYL